MARARVVKALYAAATVLLLVATAPACTAPAAAPSAAARTSAPAPAPVAPPGPRAPGVRGLEVAVPAYVGADAPMLSALAAAGPAVSVVVLNPGNGDSPFDARWQARADALRAGTTATGERTKVLGYVHTDHGNRDVAAVKASVDNYVKTPDGRLHVDGVFFDVVGRDCGPANATRDLYEQLRHYVEDAMHATDPSAGDLVVNNPGTAIADCYLEPGHRTADVFVTFEDTYAAYTSGGWLGGNVFNTSGGYRAGSELDPSGTAFWHLVHDVPDASAMRSTLRTAFDRGAGYAYATSAAMPNPWNTPPAWPYSGQTGFATLG
ncbi:MULTISPECIES: spherulation-specific family 4 protein [unclassified Streptomyces]|uniref:spherulation-specific family 4 protein n=1 Tax=unclassified Streptomyces TaxID=2593676 RepID=UPI002E33067E|nr:MULTISPECIES: spherulation-specific family 4 protein [unclassified Streptomyces]WUC67631.1 spherulation-specific family 4 protein [Streptomyces sp. NBC_00539]